MNTVRKLLKSRITKYILVFVAAVVAMLVVWQFMFKNASIPITHRTSIPDGRFRISVGMIRKISIQNILIDRYHDENYGSIRVEIYSSDDNKLFEREYSDITLKHDLNDVETFDKDGSLSLPPGEYYARFYIDGTETQELIGAFTEYNDSPGKWFFGLCIAVFICTAAGLILIYFKDIKIEIAYIILALTIGIFFNVAFPPLSTWDEIDHFLTSYRMSSNVLGKPANFYEKTIMRADDADSMEFLHDISGITGWYDGFRNGDTSTDVYIGTVSHVTFKGKYTYWPQMFGISLARLLHLNGHLLLLMGRIFNLIAMVFLMALAIRIIPYGKWFYFTLGLLPTTIYLMASYSYDGLNMTLCALIVACFMNLCIEKETIRLKDIGVFLILVALMAPIKLVYLCFAFLIFLIPRKKIALSFKTMVAGGGLGVLIAALMLKFGWSRILGAVMLSDAKGGGTKYTIYNIFQNKGKVADLLVKWIYFDAYKLFRNSLGAVNSKADVAEANHYYMPVVLVFITVLLFIAALEDTRDNPLSSVKRGMIFLIGLGSFILIVLAMLIGHTQTTDWKLTGVQGRYLIPIYFLVPAVIKNRHITLNIDRRKVIIAGMTFINLCFVVCAIYYFMFEYFAGVYEFMLR